MRRTISLVATLTLLAGAHMTGLGAVAQPQIPAAYFGSASIDGKPVPDGTEIRGFIDGKDCTQLGPAYQGTVNDGGVSAYSILVMHESQAPGCGSDGKTVTFTIGGVEAQQTAKWAAGPAQVDLNAGAGEPLPLPTPTPTPTPDPAQTATAPGATATQLQGTPPTDPIELPETPRPPGTPTLVPRGEADEDGGGDTPMWLMVAGVLLVLAAAGGTAGYLLSRRKRDDSAAG